MIYLYETTAITLANYKSILPLGQWSNFLELEVYLRKKKDSRKVYIEGNLLIATKQKVAL